MRESVVVTKGVGVRYGKWRVSVFGGESESKLPSNQIFSIGTSKFYVHDHITDIIINENMTPYNVFYTLTLIYKKSDKLILPFYDFK